MLPSDRIAKLEQLLGAATADLSRERDRINEMVSRSLKYWSDEASMKNELQQARESLQYQRAKSARLRRERWESKQFDQDRKIELLEGERDARRAAQLRVADLEAKNERLRKELEALGGAV